MADFYASEAAYRQMTTTSSNYPSIASYPTHYYSPYPAQYYPSVPTQPPEPSPPVSSSPRNSSNSLLDLYTLAIRENERLKIENAKLRKILNDRMDMDGEDHPSVDEVLEVTDALGGFELAR